MGCTEAGDGCSERRGVGTCLSLDKRPAKVASYSTAGAKLMGHAWICAHSRHAGPYLRSKAVAAARLARGRIAGRRPAVVAMSSFYDDRSTGTRLDAGVEAASAKIERQTSSPRDTAGQAAQGAGTATDRVAGAIGDAGITAAIETALAADASLRAVSIAVTTREGWCTSKALRPTGRHVSVLKCWLPHHQAWSVENRFLVPGETQVI